MPSSVQRHKVLEAGRCAKDKKSETLNDLLIDFIKRNPADAGAVPRIPHP